MPMQSHTMQCSARPWHEMQCMEQTQFRTARWNMLLRWTKKSNPLSSHVRDGGRVKKYCLHTPCAKLGHQVCRDESYGNNIILYTEHTPYMLVLENTHVLQSQACRCVFVRAMLVSDNGIKHVQDWSVSTLHCSFFQLSSLSHHPHPIVTKHTPHRRSSPMYNMRNMSNKYV